MIELSFLNDWRLELYFYKQSTTFLFNHVVLYYKLNGPLFPYSTHNEAQSEVYDDVFINSTLSKSYTCLSGIQIDLGEVVIYLKNLRLEPFFNKRPNLPFDSEILCPGDIKPDEDGNISNFWFLVGASVVAGLVCFLCTLFVCLGCKKRDEYQNITRV